MKHGYSQSLQCLLTFMSVAINHESFSSIEPSLAEVCCQKGCNLSRRKESRLHTFFFTQVQKEYLCLAQGAGFEIPTFLGDTLW